jgi:hypothetical protein
MIKFNDYTFSEPTALPASSAFIETIAGQPGVYAVLVFDPTCTPRPYRPVYFGESDNIHGRAAGTHENHSSWRAEAGTNAPLYRALCPLPGLTKTQRQQVESVLIAEYSTPCNRKLSFAFARLLGVV